MMFEERPKDISFVIRSAYPKRHRGTYVMSIIFFSILAVGYIGFRTSSIFATPEIDLESPPDGARISGSSVQIRGNTEPKVRLTVNGYESYSDPEGRFDLQLPFQPGFHIVDVRVINRIGREAKVVRRIVVE